MRIRVGVIEPFPDNACSYYRSYGVLSKLDIDIYPIDKLDWKKLLCLDVLYIFRPDHENYIKLIETAKNMKIPVILDWDDNILEIPKYNPSYAHYQERKQVIIECLQMADHITVSTEAMKVFSAFNNNLTVIENAFNDYNYDLKSKGNEGKTILWRGSATHRDDLLTVAEEMYSTARKNKEWVWIFLGGDPWYIANNIKNSAMGESVDMLSYNSFLMKDQHAIMQVPLEVNDFNRSKSNIAWIEGTINGCATVAQDLPEFVKPGVSNYDTPEKYQYQIEKLIGSKEYRGKQYKLSADYIMENLRLSEVNKKRMDVIEGLI